MSEKLGEYRRKRDFRRTPEPSGGDGRAPAGEGRFVVHEHHARRLHWDLRLEHGGALASWAIPNGIPDDPKRNRKAVRTEDHPLEYIDFHGEIPKGEYGAGSMTIWDAGTYEAEKWRDDEVIATFSGEKLNGTYALFRTGPAEGDWMIHRKDPPADPTAEPLPEKLAPMLAVPGKLPEGDGWTYEVKWDGIRAIAYIEPGRIRLESRNLRDITAGYPEIGPLTRALGSRSAVLDGELVAFDEEGRPSFERLQQRMHVRSSAIKRLAKDIPVTYAIFDVLYLDGHSLMDRPWHERRGVLEELGLEGPAWRVALTHPDGSALLEATSERGIEGIVAKRVDCPYEPGRRAKHWVKVKHVEREPFVIGGWLPGEGRRKDRIGALLVGARDGSELRYCGRVGTGFTESELDRLAAVLGPLERETNPFSSGGKPPKAAVWVEPRLEAEVEFRERTSQGILRAPSYKGLRERPVTGRLAPGEVEVDGRRLKLSNLDKVLYPATGFTKGEVIDYYARIAPMLVPHLSHRPLTLKRYPNGVDDKFFYEKNCPSHAPDWVATTRMGSNNFCMANDLATVVWLANLASLELHPSLARAEDVKRPTSMVFDLDPGEPAGLVECCQVAVIIRDLFARLGLECVAKTSGSKGIQVYVPLNTTVTYGQTKPFARAVAELLQKQAPDLVVSRQTKALRTGKVLVDWSQNDEHKTTVSVYSMRARERPTVSTPLRWEEVEAGDPAALVFEAGDVLDRVDVEGDLFAPLLSLHQELPALG